MQAQEGVKPSGPFGLFTRAAEGLEKLSKVRLPMFPYQDRQDSKAWISGRDRCLKRAEALKRMHIRLCNHTQDILCPSDEEREGVAKKFMGGREF